MASFPLAYLFELGGETIWALALLHFVIQATVKVVVFSQGAESFALVWMAASALIPLLVFTVKSSTHTDAGRVGIGRSISDLNR